MDFRKILMIFHAIGGLCIGVWSLTIRTPTLLLLAITWNILLMIQWLVLGGCVLTQIETPGASNSHILIWVAEVTATPIDAVKVAWVLINTCSPLFFHLSRLAGVLGV